MDVLPWIEASPAARFIATAPFVYPAISAVHVLGIALLVGSIVPVDLRLLRALGPQFDLVLPSLTRLAVLGFVIAASSGMLLACVRIADYAQNPAFLAKLVILLAAGANALLLRVLSGRRNVVDMGGRPAGRTAAMASLGLWASAVFAGRWIAFS